MFSVMTGENRANFHEVNETTENKIKCCVAYVQIS